MAMHKKLWTLLGLAAGAAVGFWLWREGEDRSSRSEFGTPADDPAGRPREAASDDGGPADREPSDEGGEDTGETTRR